MSPRAVLIVAWLGWVFDVMDTALFNFAKQPMLTEMMGAAAYKATGAAVEGRIQTAFLIGWAIGGLVFGILADRWGRSRTLVVTILLYSALTGLTALAQTPDQVLVLRFLTALGIGGEWAAGAAMVAEAYRSGGRVGAAAWLQTAAAFGPWLAALANLKIRTGDWRALFLIGVIPAAMVVFVRFKADRGHEAQAPAKKSVQPLV
ncbi:MAG: MFS transporter, partial [Acetobacteraceae bacterium]